MDEQAGPEWADNADWRSEVASCQQEMTRAQRYLSPEEYLPQALTLENEAAQKVRGGWPGWGGASQQQQRLTFQSANSHSSKELL